MNSTSRIARSALLGLGALLFACADSPTGVRTATVIVRLMTPATVASVTVEVSGPGLSPPVVVNIPVGADSVAWDTLTVTAGSGRRFVVTAVDTAGVQTHRADTTLTLVSGTNAPLVLRLDPLSSTLGITVTFGGIRLVVPDTSTRVLEVGGSTLIEAYAIRANGDSVPGDSLVWGASNPAIAVVDAGVVAARRVGATRISVSYGATAMIVPVNVAVPTVPGYVPRDGLVSWWSFDNTLEDLSDNANTLEFRGSSTFGADRWGRPNFAYFGDGQGGADMLAQAGFPFGNAGRSISIWFAVDPTNTSQQQLFAYGNNTTGGRFGVFRTSSAIGVEFATVAVTTPTTLDAAWHHIVVTYPDAGAGSDDIRIFLDGQPGSTSKIGNVSTLNTTNENWIKWIGTLQVTSPWLYSWDGSIDDIGIWSRQLSQAEITALYESLTITTHPAAVNVGGGQQATMHVVASSTTGASLTYQWQRNDGSGYVNISNGDEYDGTTTATLTIRSAQVSQRGVFRCVVSTANATVNSNGASLTVTSASP